MKKDTRHKEVILAFLEGREVQVKTAKGWIDATEPSFGDAYDYRINPQPQLIPFDFSDAEMLIGRMVKSKDGKIVSVITDLTRNTVWMSASDKSYNELLSEFTFLNGTPCGQKNQD
jgi:hypothetical protein